MNENKFWTFVAISVTIHLAQFTALGVFYRDLEQKLNREAFSTYQNQERVRTDQILQKLSSMEAKIEILLTKQKG